MSITGSMQLVGQVAELLLRVAALEENKGELEAKVEKLGRDFQGLRMRTGWQKPAAEKAGGDEE